jgi:hypothetical protein
VFGNTTTEDYSAQEAGNLDNPAVDPIWDPGQTVEYYVRVRDDAGNFTSTADWQLNFRVLPFYRSNGLGRKILVVDLDRDHLDFERSHGFDPTGGVGFGTFNSPVYAAASTLVERGLAIIYGGSPEWDGHHYGQPKWDVYHGIGWLFPPLCDPRVISNVGQGLGGIASDLGVPNYDAVIWTGSAPLDTTRMDLKIFLDTGGKLLMTGDNIALRLGSEGDNADSTIHFLPDYLGTAFPNSQDGQFGDRVLNVQGAAGASLNGLTTGLYCECPDYDGKVPPDKLTLAAPRPGQNANSVLATYQAGDAATNGRAAIIKNIRVEGNGVAVLCGFDTAHLVSDVARACIFSKVFATDFGLAAPFSGCVNSGTDVPALVMSPFGFEFARPVPNPFSEATSIKFSVPARSHVSVEVYNVLGQRVRTLVDETLEANSYVRRWDGRGDMGLKLSSGLYFCRMSAGTYTKTQKVVLVK